MGYCTYTVNRANGNVVAAWIGTGTDVGRQVTVTYLKRTVRPNAAEDKRLKCADVRRQFCIKYTGNANCNRRTTSTRPSRGGSAAPTVTKTSNPIDSIAKAVNDIINNVLGLKPTGTTPTTPTPTPPPQTPQQKIIAGNIQKEKEENERFVKNLQDKGIPDLCATLPPPFNDCYVTGITAMVIVGSIIMIAVVLK